MSSSTSHNTKETPKSYTREYRKEYYAKNKEKLTAYNRAYITNNRIKKKILSENTADTLPSSEMKDFLLEIAENISKKINAHQTNCTVFKSKILEMEKDLFLFKDQLDKTIQKLKS